MNRIAFLFVVFALSSSFFFSSRLVGVAVDLADAAEYLKQVIFFDNFHSVVPGRFYRSGEMTHQELAQTVRKFGIKTVLDLRCGETEDGQEVSEEDALKGLGVHYQRVPITSGLVPTATRIEKVLEFFRTQSPPYLVHCTNGTHRTGFVSFLYLLEIEKQPLEEALSQVSPHYGYFQWERALKAYRANRRMLDDVLWEFVAANRETGVGVLEWASRELEKEASFPPAPDKLCTY